MKLARRAVRLADTGGLRLLRPEHRASRLAAGGLSRAAHGGGLWWTISGALAARPGRSRAAAVNGAVAWLAASAASGASKRVIDRRRPPTRALLGGAVHSSSMPSSHATTAAAYTVAAVARAPLSAVVLVPLAGAVCWSRPAAGRHFPTDVAAGVGLGAVVGSVVVVVDRRRRRRANAGRSGASEVEPNP